MSKCKKPRNKKYRPKDVTYAGGLHMIDDGFRRFATDFPMPDAQRIDVLAHVRLSLLNLEQGIGSRESWGTIACALNTGMVLAERGIGAEYESAFVLALDGLYKSEQRAAKFGAHRLDGDSIQAVRHAIDVHAAQLDIATHAEAMLALATVNARITAGNVYSTQSHGATNE